VGSVGDYDDVVEIVVVGYGDEAVDLLLGVGGAGFGDDAAEGYAVGKKIVTADATFGIAGVFVGASAESDDERRDVFAVEFDGVIEAGVEDGGWAAGVLGCAEDGDGVGGLGFVVVGDVGDLTIDPDAPASRCEQDEREESAEDDASGAAPQVRLRDDHRLNRVPSVRVGGGGAKAKADSSVALWSDKQTLPND